MNNYEIYFLIGSIIGFMVQTIIFIFSVVYFLKMKSTEGVLMLVGSFLSTLMFLAQPILTYVVALNMEALEIIEIQGYLNIAGSLFGILFALGFVMIVLKMIKYQEILKTQ